MKDLKTLTKNFAPTQYKQEVVIDEFAKNIINKVFDQLSIIFPAWKYNWKTDQEISSAKMEWTKAFNENGINTLEQIKIGFAKARQSESDEKISGAKKEWVKALFENNIVTKEQIACGLRKARKTNTDFIPSCGKFISWCTPSPEDLGYPSEQSALSKCVSHRNKIKMNLTSYESNFIIELVKQVDWWLMNRATDFTGQQKADKHFKEVYLNLTVNYKEPLESESARLETSNIVKDRMSEQQLEDGRKRGLDVLKDIKSKLKRKPNDVL